MFVLLPVGIVLLVVLEIAVLAFILVEFVVLPEHWLPILGVGLGATLALLPLYVWFLGTLGTRLVRPLRAVRPEDAWMLLQPRAVRRSYCEAVLDEAGDPGVLAEIWMLRQPKKVRESYIREVLQEA